ncbi:MAG: hypothetical protein ABJN95_04705 [Maribacter sp.]|uniref:hypothetical protein n=1 Tax=Maribacter sp. TaxID=1897614 RepID=UPI0032985CC4
MTSKTKNNTTILLRFALCLLLIGRLVSADYFLSNEDGAAPLDRENFNGAYEEMPREYIDFINEKPLDSIVDPNEQRASKNRVLKYDAYMQQNAYSRELVVIKKLEEGDTTQLRSISFNIYPKDKSILPNGQKFFRLTTNAVNYRYKSHNFRVAKQVLPNIGIHKIEPYSRYWKTTISYVDDTDLLASNGGKVVDKSKLTDIYNFLFEKQLERRAIGFLPESQKTKFSAHPDTSGVFVKYATENDLQLIKIQNDLQFWKKVTQNKAAVALNYINGDLAPAATKLGSYLKGELPFSAVFDEEKIASYYAILNLYGNRTAGVLYLQSNEDTGLLEPFSVSEELGTLNNYVQNLSIAEPSFSKIYAEELGAIASLAEIHDLIDDSDDEICDRLNALHRLAPTKIFDKALFYHNKLIIEKTLNPSTSTKIALIEHDENHIKVAIENLSNFPIEVAELSYKKNRFVTGPREERMVIMPLEKRSVAFDLPDSYNNLFVQKKKKTTGFVFEKDIFNLFIGYRLLGTPKTIYNTITPFKDLDELTQADDMFRAESSLSTFDFLTVDELNKSIRFASDSIILEEPLVLPAGYVVHADSGLQIDIKTGGKVISKSPLNFVGSAEEPIKIYSSDGNGQGVFVVGAKASSKLKYVEFDRLTNPTHGLWDLTGAVVFYESPVNLDYVVIANNSCEDGLNIIRTHFEMKNTTFKNTQSDAFDGDFVQGTLTNCTFENLGNDAIDVSGSLLEMYGVKITNAGDKALSAGEDSQMKAENIHIDQCEIAIAGKDLSIVNINNARITNSKLGFTAFQKKPEFGASDIEAKNVVMTGVETPHLIENRSSLLLNGEQAETIDQVKEQMYGVEFGVDSKETRVKKKQ